MSNFFLKLKIFINLILQLSNWHVLTLHYFGLRKNVDIIKFRNGTCCILRDKSDAIAFLEIFLLKINNLVKDFHVKKNDVIIDIGAHIGYFTIYSAKIATQGKVYSYEPSPESFNFLKKNIELNKIKNVILENLGVMKDSGISEMYVNKNNTIGNTMFKKNYRSHKESVKVISLEDMVSKHNLKKIDFLKLDCEGAEFEIILNLNDDILRKINKIAIEVHPNILNYKLSDLECFLTKKEFQISILRPLKNSDMPMLYARNKNFHVNNV